MIPVKHKTDLLPLCILGVTFLADCYMLYTYRLEHWYIPLIWTFLSIPFIKGFLCAFNHHHQHVPPFKRKPLNYLIGILYASTTGVTYNTWVIHHNIDHHAKGHLGLAWPEEASSWVKPNGVPMSHWEYSFKTWLFSAMNFFCFSFCNSLLLQEYCILIGMSVCFYGLYNLQSAFLLQEMLLGTTIMA